MNFLTLFNTLCLLKKAGVDAEKPSRVSDRLVHMFLPDMPILGPNSLKDLRTFGALDPPLVTRLVGLEPLLGGELLPTGGAGQLLLVDLGVGEEIVPPVGRIVTLSTFELGSTCAGFIMSNKVFGADIDSTRLAFSDSVGVEMVRQLLVVFTHLMTDIALRLPLAPPAPVYLDLVRLDIVNFRQLGRLLGRLLGSPGCVLGLSISHGRTFLIG